MSFPVLLYNFSLFTFNYLMLTTSSPIIFIPDTFSLTIFFPFIIVGFDIILLLYNVVLLYTLALLVCKCIYSIDETSVASFCLILYNFLLVLFNCALLVYQTLHYRQICWQRNVIVSSFKFS